MALSIQERIKDLRIEHKLTLEQLAEQTGLSKSALGNYENDEFKDISHYALIKLADFYNVSVDYLLGRMETKNHSNTVIDELHLNDVMIELLKNKKIDSPLLCELASHPDFVKLLADIKIYVEGIATMQIQNLNTWVDYAREEIIKNYNPDKNDPTLHTLESAHIDENEYFTQRIHNDMDSIMKDLRKVHLGRNDSVYIDMRMLKDPGNYEAIGGDSYLSGFVKGFEVVPYPLLVNVSGLPEEVGDTYTGKTLFKEENGKYTARYEESLEILEYYFPKDKNIFLMCGGGGYAGMTKNMLVTLGWDENKIYNVGGYWYYDGENNVEVKKTNKDKSVSYDFWKVTYHDIDFNNLHKVK